MPTKQHATIMPLRLAHILQEETTHAILTTFVRNYVARSIPFNLACILQGGIVYKCSVYHNGMCIGRGRGVGCLLEEKDIIYYSLTPRV